MTYGIIYVVENTINGKKYVGQTVQPLKVRWQRHCRKEQSGCVALASAIAKYGADALTPPRPKIPPQWVDPKIPPEGVVQFLFKNSTTGGFGSDFWSVLLSKP